MFLPVKMSNSDPTRAKISRNGQKQISKFHITFYSLNDSLEMSTESMMSLESINIVSKDISRALVNSNFDQIHDNCHQSSQRQ